MCYPKVDICTPPKILSGGKETRDEMVPSCSLGPKKPHALVIPFPVQGHIGPMMHLSIKLATEAGFVITFVNTHHHHASLKHHLEPRFREHGLHHIHLAQVVNAGCASGDSTGAKSIPELCASFFKLTPAFEDLWSNRYSWPAIIKLVQMRPLTPLLPSRLSLVLYPIYTSTSCTTSPPNMGSNTWHFGRPPPGC